MATNARKTGASSPGALAERVGTRIKNTGLVQRKRTQIIRAAIKVFDKKGYHGATLRDIGRVAKLTQGTMFNYIESKEDILFLVCDWIVGDYQNNVRSSIEEVSASGSPSTRLRASLRATVATMYDHRVEIALLYREHKHLNSRSQKLVQERINEFLVEIEGLLVDVLGENSRYNSRFACNMTTFLPVLFGLRSWVTPAGMSEEEQIDQVVSFMCVGLGIPEIEG